uniref:Uncharacterized protein n=1 Tax=Triticum urartu TaxID=4572 RepID=A0A8R7UGA7_TRIUA
MREAFHDVSPCRTTTTSANRSPSSPPCCGVVGGMAQLGRGGRPATPARECHLTSSPAPAGRTNAVLVKPGTPHQAER